MVGIYIIRNKINDKVYIGRSTDIHRRWIQHLRDARNGDKCKIHLAMQKYGIDNFYIEVLEECDISELNKREQYYIEKFDSWQNGYNNGNADYFGDGENNPLAKVTEQNVKDIRIRQSKMTETRKDIYKDYKDKITWTNFSFICKYITWTTVLPELNTPEIMSWHMKQIGNEAKKFSEEDLINIVILRNKEKLSYQKIADLYGKHRKTIERIFIGIYYKEEIKQLKIKRPDLFQS